ncbi:DUF6941 family protein [Streptomyces sp. NPDC057302]|uniref:DUF6941 family protein n=1 Tax=Streptomyces sp. NPDC057302 TaxID=3346094 RepID=UPI0036440A76
MGIANDTHVSIFLADFANADPTGKVNAIGAGWQMVTMTPETGATAPHAVVVLISAAPSVEDTEVNTTLTLCDASGEVVQIPGPAGDPQALQVVQSVRLDRPTVQQFPQREKLWSQGKVIINLPTGLPLQVDHEYQWVFKIEGVSGPQWMAPFFVVQPSELREQDQPSGTAEVDPTTGP